MRLVSEPRAPALRQRPEAFGAWERTAELAESSAGFAALRAVKGAISAT